MRTSGLLQWKVSILLSTCILMRLLALTVGWSSDEKSQQTLLKRSVPAGYPYCLWNNHPASQKTWPVAYCTIIWTLFVCATNQGTAKCCETLYSIYETSYESPANTKYFNSCRCYNFTHSFFLSVCSYVFLSISFFLSHSHSFFSSLFGPSFFAYLFPSFYLIPLSFSFSLYILIFLICRFKMHILVAPECGNIK